MPKLKEIATIINNSLAADYFSSQRFSGGRFIAITDENRTEEVDGKEISQPLYIDDNGEGKSVVFDDTYPFTIFHKIDTLTYKIADNDYGKAGTWMEETANIKMIFFGTRSKLKVAYEDIIAAAVLDFPKELNQYTVSSLGLTTALIEMGDVDTNMYSVWSKEYPNTPCELNSNNFGFSIPYKVITTYSGNCFKLSTDC